MKKSLCTLLFIALGIGCTSKYEKVSNYEGISPFLDSLKSYEDSLILEKARDYIGEFYKIGSNEEIVDSLGREKSSQEQENYTENQH
jgi:hypothetical protein